MLRSLILALLCIASVSGAIWPEHLGRYERKSDKPVAGQPSALADEYGRDEAEEARYGPFVVLAQRFKDSTGAYAAALEMREPPLQVGNYLITRTGNCPKNLPNLAETLPKISHAALPTL